MSLSNKNKDASNPIFNSDIYTDDSIDSVVNIRVIDSHCHLNYKGLVHQVDDVIKRAHNAGVSKMISICTHLAEVEEIYGIAQKHICVHSTVGVHPHDALSDIEKYGLKGIESTLRKYADRSRIVGIGETGLDYYYDNSPRDIQREVFELHIKIASEYDLPLVVHTREAEKDTIDMLSKYNGNIRGVIHCFTGSQWLADKALELGFYISIPGVITFKSASEIRKVIMNIPHDRLLIETDAPFLAPVPHRGKTNEPAFVVETLKYVADMLDIPVREMADITRKNTLSLFDRII